MVYLHHHQTGLFRLPGYPSRMLGLFLVLRHAVKAWKMLPREWVSAKTKFPIIFEDRFFVA
jgi:transposase-like protein